MSDFLMNVLARSTGQARTIQPRLPSRFEPLQSAPEEIFQESFEQSSSLVLSSSQPSAPPSPQSAQGQSKPILRSTSELTDQASNSNSAVAPESSNSLIQASKGVTRSSATAPLNSAQANSELHSHLDTKEKDLLSARSPLVIHDAESHKTEVRSPVLQPQITRVQEPASFANLPTPREPTVIKVIIGRVEIRATTTPIAAPSSPPSYQPPQPDLSLENYLRSRNGGGG